MSLQGHVRRGRKGRKVVVCLGEILRGGSATPSSCGGGLGSPASQPTYRSPLVKLQLETKDYSLQRPCDSELGVRNALCYVSLCPTVAPQSKTQMATPHFMTRDAQNRIPLGFYTTYDVFVQEAWYRQVFASRGFLMLSAPEFWWFSTHSEWIGAN